MGLRLLGKGRHRVASTVAKDGRSSLEIGTWFDSYETNSGISEGGADVDLNSGQRGTDSPKEVLKQTMLHHEIIFRNQVLELHRLYWTQKNLMNDLCWKDFDKNVMWTPKHAVKLDFLAPHSPMMSSTLAQSSSPLEECKGNSYGFHHDQQRNFNLQLPVDEYIKDAANDCLEIQNSVGNKILDDADSEEVELTLGNRIEDSNEKNGVRRTICGKEVYLCSRDVIDLEEKSSELMSNEEVNVVSSFCFKTPKATSSGRKKESGCTPSEEYSHAYHSERLRELSSSHLDFGWNEIRGYSSTDLFNQKQQSTSYKHTNFDLNTTQLEESSDISHNHVVTIPSSASSSAVFRRVSDESHTNTLPMATLRIEQSSRCSKETSVTLQASAAYSTGKEADLPSHGCHDSHPYNRQSSAPSTKFPRSSWNCDQDEVDPVALGSDVEDNNFRPSFESTNLPQTVAGDSELKQANRERSEEDTLSFSPCGNHNSAQGTISSALWEQQDGHCGEVPTGDESDHITRNNQCTTGDETGQLSLMVTEKCYDEQEAITKPHDHVCLQEKSCSHSELEPEEHTDKKEEHAVEVYCMIRRAAESLVHLSSEKSARSLDKFANVGRIELENEERSDQPQYSSDSFESIVLTLTESVDDEYSMPAWLTEEETGQDACRFRSRKGRWLRDFQEDILPGLVTLSRHEICEDLYNIAEAVRLHEFRMGCRKPCWGNWYTPVRSRRPRLNCIGPRH